MWLKYYKINKGNNELEYLGETVKNNKYVPTVGQTLSLIDVNSNYIQYNVVDIETVYDYDNFMESYELYKINVILEKVKYDI